MHALEGVRVIDFGQYLAGPFGPMIVADLGADVIKVEPVAGDGMRMAAAPFFGCQRGKRDIALNIKDSQGHRIALELVARADIVHHNMTKGTASRLGLDYEACRTVKPDVVYCNTYAYGLEGPLSDFGGLDPLYQASSGVEYEQGASQFGNEPLYPRFGMIDASNAMLSVVGALAALYRTRTEGGGQEVWTSLLDGGAVMTSDTILTADGDAQPRPKLDKDLYGVDPSYCLYHCQDDEWIQVAAVKPEQWTALCETARVNNDAPREEIGPALAQAFRQRTALQWSRALDDAGVPNEVAIDTHAGDLMLFDGDNERAGLVVEYDHPIVGRLRQFGELIRFSETPGRIYGPPPRVGEHTKEILTWLGYDDAQMDALKSDGVVTWPDENYPRSS
jgi:crotonobetainyl-CoA:carnitine CoA-transferase CaiB-like acyl-CoA transferase